MHVKIAFVRHANSTTRKERKKVRAQAHLHVASFLFLFFDLLQLLL